MRQGRIFYEAAEVLPPRASPLNFYYSFMNFAKACIVMHDPTFIGGHVIHGLSPSSPSRNLRMQYLSVKSGGVFPLFCRLVTGKTIVSKSKLKIIDLFGYARDVSFEYESLKYGRTRSCPAKFIVGINNTKIIPYLMMLYQKSFQNLLKACRTSSLTIHFPMISSFS